MKQKVCFLHVESSFRSILEFTRSPEKFPQVHSLEEGTNLLQTRPDQGTCTIELPRSRTADDVYRFWCKFGRAGITAEPRKRLGTPSRD